MATLANNKKVSARVGKVSGKLNKKNIYYLLFIINLKKLTPLRNRFKVGGFFKLITE